MSEQEDGSKALTMELIRSAMVLDALRHGEEAMPMMKDPKTGEIGLDLVACRARLHRVRDALGKEFEDAMTDGHFQERGDGWLRAAAEGSPR